MSQHNAPCNAKNKGCSTPKAEQKDSRRTAQANISQDRQRTQQNKEHHHGK